MVKYRWSCQICDEGNQPFNDHCIKCGFPSSATGQQIEHAKRMYPTNDIHNLVTEKADALPFGLGAILVLAGGVTLKFGFFGDSVTVGFMGFGMLMTGAWVIDLSGYKRKKRNDCLGSIGHTRSGAFNKTSEFTAP